MGRLVIGQQKEGSRGRYLTPDARALLCLRPLYIRNILSRRAAGEAHMGLHRGLNGRGLRKSSQTIWPKATSLLTAVFRYIHGGSVGRGGKQQRRVTHATEKHASQQSLIQELLKGNIRPTWV